MKTSRARRLFVAAAMAASVTAGALTTLAGPAGASLGVTTTGDSMFKRPPWDQIDPNLCAPGTDIDKCYEAIKKYS